jgi:hypothetical protein
MNTKQTHKSATDTKRDLSREASGKHQGVRQPGDDQRVEQALDDAGLDDLGASVEDEIRGRRGSGVAPADDVRSDGKRRRAQRTPLTGITEHKPQAAMARQQEAANHRLLRHRRTWGAGKSCE